MQMTGISSSSVVRYHVNRLPGIRLAAHGRVIPHWVDDVFKAQQKKARA
jgi:hypothetical protein